MRNQKGLTLVEVLGSIVLLSIAILSLTYILQQSAVHSKDNEKQDEAVVITRNVMEEIKNSLRSRDTLDIYGQVIPLDKLRDLSANVTIYYPSIAAQQYKIHVVASNASLGQVSIPGYTSNADDIFRRITVSSLNLTTSRAFELDAYIEYK